MSLWSLLMRMLPPNTAGTLEHGENHLRNCRKLFDCVCIARWRRLIGDDGSSADFGHLIAHIYSHTAT